MERVMIFIDGSNILHALLRLKERGLELKLDYQKLVNLLVGGRELRRSYFYCGKSSPPSEGQERFLKSLQRMGIAVETNENEQPAHFLRRMSTSSSPFWPRRYVMNTLESRYAFTGTIA